MLYYCNSKAYCEDIHIYIDLAKLEEMHVETTVAYKGNVTMPYCYIILYLLDAYTFHVKEKTLHLHVHSRLHSLHTLPHLQNRFTATATYFFPLHGYPGSQHWTAP